MPRRLLQRYLPDFHELRQRRGVRVLGRLLDDPFLLHLNRRSVAGGVAIGLFVAFLPLPLQMLMAAGLAIVIRVNLIIAVVLVWVSNPLTMAPMFYFSYIVGTWLIGPPVFHTGFEPTLAWFWSELRAIWRPLLLGSTVVGGVVAMAAYGVVNLLWRLYIIRALAHRARRHRAARISVRQSRSTPRRRG